MKTYVYQKAVSQLHEELLEVNNKDNKHNSK